MGPSSKWLAAATATAALLACSQRLSVTDVVDPSLPKAANAPKPPSTLSPVFNGATTAASTAPRPIAGGTLLTVAIPDKPVLAVASDPDEDAIDVVSLQPSAHFLGQVLLQPGDEPGRLVADAIGRVHVILREAGAVATIYPYGPSLLERRAVCSAPRGIDYDPAHDALVVVCATGEVMSLPASGGDAVQLARIDRDLRDVVVDRDTLYVTRFRTAEVLSLDLTGKVLGRLSPSVPTDTTPDVAWRTVRNPAGSGVIVLHQVASTQTINVDATPPPSDGNTPTAAYGSNPLDPTQVSVVATAVSTMTVTGIGRSIGLTTIPAAFLDMNPAVDVAVSPDGMFEVVGLTGLIELGEDGQVVGGVADLSSQDPTQDQPDEFVAIADARQAGAVVVQRRSVVPAIIVIPTGVQQHPGPPLPNQSLTNVTITLPQRVSHVDTGLDVFHVPTGAGVACMNCHPEGGDDGHTWMFRVADKLQVRRTISLRGGTVANTAPYHWNGDMLNMQALCDEIFTHRMGGGAILPQQAELLARFLSAVPRIPVYAGLDPSAVARGRTIFEGSGGCITCHSGPLGTSPYNQDVGKVDSLKQTAPMQIPMLIGVADRAPYLHDGCAATLMDRLTDPSCAGTKHGSTDTLAPGQLSDLETYLESL